MRYSPKQESLFQSLNIDERLNNTLTKAIVDSWQSKNVLIISPAQDEPGSVLRNRPLVSLTAAVEAHFANAIFTKTGERDIVPRTTNRGIKYKRRILSCDQF